MAYICRETISVYIQNMFGEIWQFQKKKWTFCPCAYLAADRLPVSALS